MPNRAYILLIEDNEEEAELIADNLGKNCGNYELEIVLDGMSAINHLSQPREMSLHKLPALIILDMMLPDTSGVDLLNLIKSNPALMMIPVTVFSGVDVPETIAKAYQARANSYTVKPGNPSDYIKKLKEVIDFFTCVVRLPNTYN